MKLDHVLPRHQHDRISGNCGVIETARLAGEAMDHRNNFDLLRLFAACQVVSMHAGEWLQLPIPAALGHLLTLFPGVPIFFVISGFLVTASFVNSDSTAQYFAKRALRIYPAMWVNLCAIVAMM